LWLFTRPSLMPGPIVDARRSEPCVMNRNYGRQETGCRVSWRKNRWIEAQEPANRAPRLSDSRASAAGGWSASKHASAHE
jgi:hypothetical protein